VVQGGNNVTPLKAGDSSRLGGRIHGNRIRVKTATATATILLISSRMPNYVIYKDLRNKSL
jgi:hypothetical protein